MCSDNVVYMFYEIFLFLHYEIKKWKDAYIPRAADGWMLINSFSLPLLSGLWKRQDSS